MSKINDPAKAQEAQQRRAALDAEQRSDREKTRKAQALTRAEQGKEATARNFAPDRRQRGTSSEFRADRIGGKEQLRQGVRGEGHQEARITPGFNAHAGNDQQQRLKEIQAKQREHQQRLQKREQALQEKARAQQRGLKGRAKQDFDRVAKDDRGR